MTGRIRRVAKSSSQFHLHVKRSNAAGARGGPKSAHRKVMYDLGLDVTQGQRNNRVAAVFIGLPKGVIWAANNPLKMAAACERRAHRSKYANGLTGQMLHIDIALPADLSIKHLIKLGEELNLAIRDSFQSPSYGALHNDAGNPHLHASVPLYQIRSRKNGDYVLTERIPHARRPEERAALGLPKSRATDLIALRKKVAHLIADFLCQCLKDQRSTREQYHDSERWRWGYLLLEQQLSKAAARGDVQFLVENMGREATYKEYHTIRNASVRAEQTGAALQTVRPIPESQSARLLTQVAVYELLLQAQNLRIKNVQWLARFMRDHGLVLELTGTPGKCATGVRYRLNDGPFFSGKQLGASLYDLKRIFAWEALPVVASNQQPRLATCSDYKSMLLNAGHVPEDILVKSILSVGSWQAHLYKMARSNQSQPAAELTVQTTAEKPIPRQT